MKWPSAFRLIWRLRPDKKNELLVSKKTQIVIEGYPRCANTFMVIGFKMAQESEVEVAHHLHAPAQLLWGLKNGIPSVVLIRDPYAAIASNFIRDDGFSLQQCIDYYIAFYKPLVKNRASFVVAEFNKVIDNLPGVIDEINRKFTAEFSNFENFDKNKSEKIFSSIEKIGGDQKEHKIARPSNDRKSRKKEIISRLELDDFNSGMKEAVKLYQQLTQTN